MFEDLDLKVLLIPDCEKSRVNLSNVQDFGTTTITVQDVNPTVISFPMADFVDPDDDHICTINDGDYSLS